jgi:hypothetical protein
VAIYLESPKGGKYNLHLRTERGQNLYLDGKKLGEAYYSDKKKRFDFPLELSPGKRHLLLFKVFSAGGGNSGWWGKITNSEGKAANDLKVYYTGN